jgi:hypothetical protein
MNRTPTFQQEQKEKSSSSSTKLVPPEFAHPVNNLITQFHLASSNQIQKLQNDGCSTTNAIDMLLKKLSRSNEGEFLEEEISLMMEITGLDRREAVRVLLLREELYSLRTRGWETTESIQVLLSRLSYQTSGDVLSGMKRTQLENNRQKQKRQKSGSYLTTSFPLSYSTLRDTYSSSSSRSSSPSRTPSPSPSPLLNTSEDIQYPRFSPTPNSQTSSPSYSPTLSSPGGEHDLFLNTDEFIYDPLYSPSPLYPQEMENNNPFPSTTTTTFNTQIHNPSQIPRKSIPQKGSHQDSQLQEKMTYLMMWRIKRLERKKLNPEIINPGTGNGNIGGGNEMWNHSASDAALRYLCFKRSLSTPPEESQPLKKLHLTGLDFEQTRFE